MIEKMLFLKAIVGKLPLRVVLLNDVLDDSARLPENEVVVVGIDDY